MWESLSSWEKIGLIFILMGSIVDLFQFMWLVKSWVKKSKTALYDRVRKEILLSQLHDIQHKQQEDSFPGIKVGSNENRDIRDTRDGR